MTERDCAACRSRGDRASSTATRCARSKPILDAPWFPLAQRDGHRRCDGTRAAVDEEAAWWGRPAATPGAIEVRVRQDEAEREALWGRRGGSCRWRFAPPGLLKINHDVVVPRGAFLNCSTRSVISRELPASRGVVRTRRRRQHPRQPDGRQKRRADELRRARQAERRLFERCRRAGGSISGEHGIGFAKAPYLSLELSAEEIALMKRVKAAFDPAGILNPGKIFPPVSPEIIPA